MVLCAQRFSIRGSEGVVCGVPGPFVPIKSNQRVLSVGQHFQRCLVLASRISAIETVVLQIASGGKYLVYWMRLRLFE